MSRTGVPVAAGGPRRVAAVVLAAVIVGLLATAPPLAARAHQSLSTGVSTAVLVVGFLLVGFLLAWRKPGNLVGWLMLAAVFFMAVQSSASLYVVADYRVRAGELPLGSLALLLQPSWAPAIVAFGLLVLLFPDGRLPSPRWRWLLRGYLLVGGVWIAGTVVITVDAIVANTVTVDSGGNLLALSQPGGSDAWWGAVQNVFFPVLVICWLLSVGAQVASFRRSTGERRQQMKWLVAGLGTAIAAPALSIVAAALPWQVAHAIGGQGIAGIVALPVSLGVAILKYRLYEIDRIVSRTLAYAVVTGLLVGVYAALVALASVLTGSSSPLVVAASTLVVAALFNPVRGRVQRVVDRRFNRARYDAADTVAAFSSHLQDEVDLAQVQAELVRVVRQVLAPGQVSVWTPAQIYDPGLHPG